MTLVVGKYQKNEKTLLQEECDRKKFYYKKNTTERNFTTRRILQKTFVSFWRLCRRMNNQQEVKIKGIPC